MVYLVPWSVIFFVRSLDGGCVHLAPFLTGVLGVVVDGDFLVSDGLLL